MTEQDPAAEAARWFARLRSGTMNAGEHRDLAAWRAAAPDHDAAWTRVDALWRFAAMARDDSAIAAMRAAALTRSPRIRWMPFAGMAAAAALVVTVSATLLSTDRASRDDATATAYAEPRMLETGAGQQASLELADGSSIILAPRSRARIGPWASERRVTLDTGEAYFKVAHAARPFVVHAGGARVTAVGTAFSVTRTDGRIRTVLAEGRVRIAPAVSGSPVTIAAGRAVTVENGRVTANDVVDAAAETGWTRGELVFAATPLKLAVGRYNRYVARPVTVAPAVARLPVSGRFAIGGGSGFVPMLSAAGMVRVTRRPDGGLLLDAPVRK